MSIMKKIFLSELKIKIIIFAIMIYVSCYISFFITGPQYIQSLPINFTFYGNVAYANSTLNVGEIYGIDTFSLGIGGENLPTSVYASIDNKTWIKVQTVEENIKLISKILPSYTYKGSFSNLGNFETKKNIDIFFMSEKPKKNFESFIVYRISVLSIFERPLSIILFFTILVGLIKVAEFLIPKNKQIV